MHYGSLSYAAIQIARYCALLDPTYHRQMMGRTSSYRTSEPLRVRQCSNLKQDQIIASVVEAGLKSDIIPRNQEKRDVNTD